MSVQKPIESAARDLKPVEDALRDLNYVQRRDVQHRWFRTNKSKQTWRIGIALYDGEQVEISISTFRDALPALLRALEEVVDP